MADHEHLVTRDGVEAYVVSGGPMATTTWKDTVFARRGTVEEAARGVAGHVAFWKGVVGW